jgi:hypothetical protein
MDRLLRMDKEQYIAAMRQEMERILGQVADAVNDAPDGQVISGSEMQVRDLMAELRHKAFEKAVQMRIDSTESSFSPSARCGGQAQAEQGAQPAERAERQRANPDRAGAVVRRGRGKRRSD